MKCKRAQKMLADYVNGILDSGDSRAIQGHIAACDSCRRELEMLEKVLSVIDDVRVEYPPASVWENFLPDLHKRIESEAVLAFGKQQRQRLYFLPGWLAVAAVLLILFGSVIIRHYQTSSPIQPQIAETDEMVVISPSSKMEDSSEQELVVGIISKVLITEAEAAELEKLKNFVQSETLTLQYHYDDELVDIDRETDLSQDDEGIIQFLLENEFAEFDEGAVVESDVGDLVKM